MTAAEKLHLISEQEYLAAELASPIKHEYLGGVVYAMAGGRNVHNDIAGNGFGSLYAQLKQHDCRPCNSDTKIRLRYQGQVRFYYPDVSVVCDRNPPDDVFQERPVVIIEVISPSSRRTDEGEKKDAYLSLPSLAVYLLVEQNSPAVVVFRRNEQGFDREVYAGMEAVVPLPEIGGELPLAELYANVEFLPDDENTDE